jgi:signal peptidase I
MGYNCAVAGNKKMKNFIREALITIALALVIFFGARQTIQTYEVFQTSMEPNFFEGQRVVVNKAVYWFGEPQRGDVIIFKAPDGRNEEFIKRVIGLPGDTIKIDSGTIYINGVKLEEPYVKRSFSYSLPEEKVPDSSYFVLGDNRDVSNDSHRGWFMPGENLIGKAWLLTWPPSDWGIVPSYHLSEQLVSADNS